MKTILVLTSIFCLIIGTHGLKNYLDDPLYPCVKCLCHAVSGCWERPNCAKYSISFEYWKYAGYLTANPLSNDPTSESTYRECITNENCIVGTIIEYTKKFGRIDCNCDGSIDCKDMLAVHLFAANCKAPVYNEARAYRFNECFTTVNTSPMLAKEGENCIE